MRTWVASESGLQGTAKILGHDRQKELFRSLKAFGPLPGDREHIKAFFNKCEITSVRGNDAAFNAMTPSLLEKVSAAIGKDNASKYEIANYYLGEQTGITIYYDTSWHQAYVIKSEKNPNIFNRSEMTDFLCIYGKNDIKPGDLSPETIAFATLLQAKRAGQNLESITPGTFFGFDLMDKDAALKAWNNLGKMAKDYLAVIDDLSVMPKEISDITMAYMGAMVRYSNKQASSVAEKPVQAIPVSAKPAAAVEKPKEIRSKPPVVEQPKPDEQDVAFGPIEELASSLRFTAKIKVLIRHFIECRENKEYLRYKKDIAPQDLKDMKPQEIDALTREIVVLRDKMAETPTLKWRDVSYRDLILIANCLGVSTYERKSDKTAEKKTENKPKTTVPARATPKIKSDTAVIMEGFKKISAIRKNISPKIEIKENAAGKTPGDTTNEVYRLFNGKLPVEDHLSSKHVEQLAKIFNIFRANRSSFEGCKPEQLFGDLYDPHNPQVLAAFISELNSKIRSLGAVQFDDILNTTYLECITIIQRLRAFKH
jgi:hypothetical protein